MRMFSFLNRNRKSIQQLEKYDIPPADLKQWEAFIQKAGDHELFQVNPRYLADRLGWSEQQVLDMLAFSTAEKLWNLKWDSYCAMCGHLVQQSTELKHLDHHQKCQMCGGESDIQLDREVVTRASVDQDLRRLDPASRDNADFRDEMDEKLGRVPSLHMINRPVFREMLGEQVLPPNQSLGVGRLTIFFSDLKSSTQLYQTVGDATAYRLVREHFDIVFDAVARHGGSAVKTIGDGVMGTFFEPAAALHGVIDSLKGLEALNQRENLTGNNRLRLKVGMNTGPCIVVTLNGRLDYFGSTVNIAARLSDLAQGDDIYMSKAVFSDPDARAIVDQYECDQEPATTLRGILQTVDICRLRPLDIKEPCI